MSNSNFQNSNSSSKGIFINTIELIGSIIMFMLFITLMYGVFLGNLEEMLWQLFFKIVGISKPLLAIVAFCVGIAYIPSMLSFFESLLEDMRLERESVRIWGALENPPTPLQEVAKQVTSPTSEPVKQENTQSREGVSYAVNEKGVITGTFMHKEYNTLKGIEQGSNKAVETYKNSEERKANLKRLYEIGEKIRKVEIEKEVNEKLKGFKENSNRTEKEMSEKEKEWER